MCVDLTGLTDIFVSFAVVFDVLVASENFNKYDKTNKTVGESETIGDGKGQGFASTVCRWIAKTDQQRRSLATAKVALGHDVGNWQGGVRQ